MMKFKKVLSIVLILALIGCAPVYASIYSDNDISKDVEFLIEHVVDKPSFAEGVDGLKRKSRRERILDNIKWYKKYQTVNPYYNEYCLDIKNFRNSADFIREKDMGRYDVHHNNIDPKKYFNLADNKILFDTIVRKSYSKYLPNLWLRFRGNKVLNCKNALKNSSKSTISAFNSMPNGKYFAKPVKDSLGNGAFLIEKKNDEFSITHVTKGKISLDKFINMTDRRDFLIQSYVKQDQTLSNLNPSSLNTVRIVTTRFHNKVNVLGSFLKIGANKKVIVDNGDKGGLLVGVDSDTGELKKYGFFEKRKMTMVHPSSNITLEGYKLPYWKECIEMVKKLHELFPQLTSLGWDLAITEDGPVVIENNKSWFLYPFQMINGGIKHNWNYLKTI